MAEHYLSFAEVQETLGMGPDEIRELMEAKSLHAEIVDGVIKFRQSEVRRLSKKGPTPPKKSGKDMGFVFLVDEDEEAKIEGKAYDGEDLVARVEGPDLAPDEEIIEPVDLSEEQVRNSQLLGSDAAVDFGRKASEKAMAEEFGAAQLEEDEEILEPSEVELPEPDETTLAAAVPEAGREEPPELEPVGTPGEKKGLPGSEESAVSVTGPAADAVAEETPPGEAPEEAPVETAAVEETPPARVDFELEGAKEEVEATVGEAALTFEEEETGRTVPPVPEEVETAGEEAPAEAATAAEPPVTAESALSFEEEAAAAETPQEEVTAETPQEEAAAEEVVAEEAEEPAVEEPAVEEAAVEASAAEAGEEEEALETFEVGTPEPVGSVTESAEMSVDEELGDLAAEPEVVGVEGLEAEGPTAEEEVPKPAVEAEPEAAETVEQAAEEAPVEPAFEASGTEAAREEQEEKAPVEEPAEAAAPATTAAGKDVFEELEEELAREEAGRTGTARERFEETAARKSEQPAAEPEAELVEEAKDVTEEKEGQKPEQPEEELFPVEEEQAAESEGIEVFDLEEATETGKPEEAEEEIGELVDLEEEPAEKGAAAGAAAAEKTLDQEMAELFGEETTETTERAFQAPAAAEDFDLSVFQETPAAEEAVPVTDEALFAVGEEPTAVLEEPPAQEAVAVEGVSRIRALTEERAAPSTFLFTAGVLLTFMAVTATGMLLWHIFHAR